MREKTIKFIKYWAKACTGLGVADQEIRALCLHLSGGKSSKECSDRELITVENGLKSKWLRTRFQQIQKQHKGELY